VRLNTNITRTLRAFQLAGLGGIVFDASIARCWAPLLLYWGDSGFNHLINQGNNNKRLFKNKALSICHNRLTLDSSKKSFARLLLAIEQELKW